MTRILVAEDSPTQAEYLRLLLEREGLEVACAADAPSALVLMAKQQFDLVLTDVMMPGVLDGVGLLRSLRADPASEAIPVVLLSANTDEDARVQGLAAGADDYIVKPFGARELVARVDSAISLARLRRQVASRDQELETARAQAKLRLALDAAKMGEVIFDVRAGVVLHSPGFAALLGYPNDRVLTLGEIQDRYHVDDRPDVLACRTVQTGSDEFFEVEHRIIRADGSARWLAARGEVTRDASGDAVEITSVYMDVTDRKGAEERQRLLLDELNHRVKNTLATVQAMASQTRRNSLTLEDFTDTFEGRLAALANAHDLLTLSSWEGATLADVIARTLKPYASVNEDGEARIASAGPVVRLGPNAAVTLNMAFHELATNASKYGSLSPGNGRLDVGWAVDRSVTPAMVDIDWTERGGPSVKPPRRRGFGSRLIEQGLERQLDGVVSLRYDPAGVHCSIRLPASSKVSPA